MNQLAKVTVPEPHMIVITPWEKEILHDIEIANLQVGSRALTEFGRYGDSSGCSAADAGARKELIKTVGKKTEEAKVALRNIRRDANEAIKKLEKDKEINEDESKRGQDSVQKLVDKFVKQMEEMRASKEKEVMEI